MTTPIYDPRVPQFAGDSLATSQPQIQTNFKTLFDAFLKNHVSLDGINPGNHTVIELLERLNPQETDVSEISIYTKNVENQTDQIFFRYQGNSKEFQFTNYQIYEIKNDSKSLKQYFTFLPGKIILYFGSFSSLENNTLNLQPFVAINIVTCSFSPYTTNSSTTGLLKPRITVLEKEEDFYKKIKVYDDFGSGKIKAPPCFYIIMANL